MQTKNPIPSVISDNCNHMQSHPNDCFNMPMSEKSHAGKNSMFSRRKLTAPALAALLLLTACGGGEEATEFALNDTNDATAMTQNEQLGEEATFVSDDQAREKPLGVVDEIDAFKNFYNNKFKNFAKTAAIAELLKQYRLIRQGSMPVLTAADLQDITYFSFAWNNLNATGKANFETNLRSALKKTTTAYTLTQLNTYITWAKNMSTATRNALKQHRQYEWHYLNTYLKTLAPASLTTHQTASQNVETADDQRYLRGTTDDGIEDYTASDGKKMVRVVYGTKRRHVERKDPVATTSWPLTVHLHRFDDPSTVIYGKNATKNPSVGDEFTPAGRTEKSDYLYGTAQEEAINHYIDLDIIKNGSLANMTESQTRIYLRQTARFLAKETGDPYDAYVRAQELARGGMMMVSAAARAALYNKWIDLAELYQTLDGRANGVITATSLATEGNVKAAVTAGISMIATNVMLTMVGWDNVEDNKAAGNTKAVAAVNAADRMQSFFAVARPITSITAYGMLGIAGTDPNVCKQNVVKWLPGVFGATDLLQAGNAFADIAYGNFTVAQKATKWTIASVNLLSGMYSVFDTVVKVQKWEYKRYQTVIPPVALGTFSAGVSCVSYAIAAAFAD